MQTGREVASQNVGEHSTGRPSTGTRVATRASSSTSVSIISTPSELPPRAVRNTCPPLIPSPQSAPKWPVGGEQPATSRGSPTYPLDVSAAFSSDRKFLTIAIVNPTELPQSLNLQVKGVQLLGEAKMWQMTGPSPEAANVLAKPPEVEVKEEALSSVPETVSIAPASITVYRFAAAAVASAM